MALPPIPNIQSWPLEGIDVESGSLQWATNEISVRESILNILLTRPGERLQRPDFGAGLLNFLHQPNTETTRGLIGGVIRKSLELWEPRVVLMGVDVEPSVNNLAEVHITIRYRMRHDQMAQELGLTLSLRA